MKENSSIKNLNKLIKTLKNLEKGKDEAFIVISKKGEIVYISESFEKISGYKNELFIKDPTNYLKLIDTKDKTKALKNFINNKSICPPSGCRFRIKDSSGNIKWIYQKCSYIFNSSGEIEYWIVSLEEIKGISPENKKITFLKDTELSFFDLTQNISIGIIFAKTNGEIIYVNKKALNILGHISEKELKKINLLNFPPLKEAGVEKSIKTALKLNKITKGEGWHKSKCGKRLYIKYQVIPLSSSGNKISGVIFTIEDFTDFKKTRENLLSHKQRYRRIAKLLRLGADNYPGLLWAKDLEGRYIFSNKGYNEFVFGKNSKNKIIGLKDKDVFKLLSRKFSLKESWEKFYSTVKQDEKEIINKRKTKRRIITFLKKRGKIVLETTESPLINEKDEIIGIVGSAKIITKEKELQEKKEKAEREKEKFKMLIEQAMESIVITDTDGNIIYVNPFFEKVTGYTYSEAIGQNPKILKSGKHDKYFYKKLWDTLLKGGTWHDIIINKKKNSELYYEDSILFPLKNKKGKIENFVAIKRDITNEIKIKEQLFQSQKMESIGRLISSVVHDFNNLLTVINGYSEIGLKKVSKENPLWKIFYSIRKTGEKAKQIMSHLLIFSRKKTVQMKTIDLNKVIKSMKSLIQKLITVDIELEFKLDPEIPLIKADPSNIEQILMNLLINAKDAIEESKKETKRIKISTQKVFLKRKEEGIEVEKEYVLLKVEDNGTGIDKELINKIFDPFFTTKPEGKGTGLGLSTVYQIVKQFNGFIDVESEKGKGASFLIYFPADKKAEFLMEEETFEEETIKGNGEKILIVEHDPDVLTFGKYILEDIGYEVLAFNNPNEALKGFINNKDNISLVILDISMPYYKVDDFILKIKEIKENQKFLILTGSSDFAIKNDNPYGIEILKKPFSIAELSKKIHTIINS